jgi:HK97 gp10 family phage protein
MARINGVDQTVQRLAGIGRVARIQIGKALVQAAALIAAEARSHSAEAGAEGSSAPDITVVRRSDLAVDVVSAGPGAVAREFGTSRMEAKPVMRTAAEAKRREVVQLIARAVGRGGGGD